MRVVQAKLWEEGDFIWLKFLLGLVFRITAEGHWLGKCGNGGD